MDATRPLGLARSHANQNGNGRNLELPVDEASEAELLLRALAPDVVSELRPPAIRAITTAPAGLFHHPLNEDLAGAIRALSAQGLDPTRRRVIDRLTETTAKPASEWRDHVGRLNRIIEEPGFKLFVSDETVDDLLEHLERHRRQRLIMLKAAELEDLARSGTDWHEPIEELAALGRLNGAVVSASTLERVSFDAFIRGDAPEIEPFWLTRVDGRPLLYPGRLHDLHAEPSVGKTWIAAEASRQVFAGGGNVLFIDFEDVGAALFTRFRALGVPDAVLADDAHRFAYLNPTGGFDALELAELDSLVEHLAPDLVIIDGVAEALARDGYDENVNADVVAWAEKLPRPLARTGAAVLMLDHVKKDPTARARGARGAGAKLAVIDGASYEVRLAHSYSRHRGGLIKLVVAKDRPGQVGSIGETVADVRVEPQANGTYVEVIVDTPPPPDEAFRPTGVMQALSERLEAATSPLTAETLINAVRKGRKALRVEALALLVAEGFVEEVAVEVPKDGSVYRSLKAFRERDDSERRRARRPTTAELELDEEPF